MKTVLVIGGTRFIGPHLVRALLNDGYDVTLANRSRSKDPWDSAVRRIRFDRTVHGSLATALGSSHWDVVVDQICYSGDEAAESRDVFEGRVGRYVLTSSGALYPFGHHPEASFDASLHPVREGSQAKLGYAEGKRQAEAVFARVKSFPVVAVRLPMVIGEGDPNHKLQYHVTRARKAAPVYVLDASTRMGYARVEEAGRFLAWITGTDITGPINFASEGTVTLTELTRLIDEIWATRTHLVEQTSTGDLSPLSHPESLTLDLAVVRATQFPLSRLDAWLPALIHAV